MHQSLRGLWETGYGRVYKREVPVPGVANDPEKMDPETVWYRKQVTLPPGDWTHASLILNGARFCPSVWINGEMVSSAKGGMAPTRHLLNHPAIKPGASVTIEISLQSLKDIDPQDASRIPEADCWRSNVSSCLWDDVILHCHGATFVSRMIASYDWAKDRVEIRWALGGTEQSASLAFQVVDDKAAVIAETELLVQENYGTAIIDLHGRCKLWSPEKPNLYTLRGLLTEGELILDKTEQTLGVRSFKVNHLRFELNDQPITVRAGSVVWHRWVRDPEGRTLAFDLAWFEENIIRRLKRHGANMLRFHLGMPPAAILDLCDRHGLLVQAEWSFFHGLKASKESAVEQWRAWLDACLQHPCVVIFHPWNETEGEEIKTGFAAIKALVPEYPPLVISHRDVIHLHRYWWSIFENVGLYYDTARQFDQPIMADEFGGNYLDGDGTPGGYPMLAESFLRFLGRNHTAERRLQLHTESNGKIAEYWRRIGAAGFSPFCILGSPPDGNSHFLGPVKDGKPKDVWDALTAAYAPCSVSLDLWDRNFLPGQTIVAPLFFFNDRHVEADFSAVLRILPAAGGAPHSEQKIHTWMAPASKSIQRVKITLPNEPGQWRIEVELLQPLSQEKRPISSWRVRTLTPVVPDSVKARIIAVPERETELRALLNAAGIRTVHLDDTSATLVLTGAATWEHLPTESQHLEAALHRGVSVVMLDIGPRDLGQAYFPEGDARPPLEPPAIKDPRTLETQLFAGVKVSFHELPEPESCFHPSEADNSLWQHLDQQATWLWNGLRGGLVVPAWDMELNGLSSDVLLALWQSRGADGKAITSGRCIAYELAGFFAYGEVPDPAIETKLRERLRFLVEDAPSLKVRLNPEGPIQIHNLGAQYLQSQSSQVHRYVPLANCGKNLSHTPVALLEFGPNRGKLVLSQLITQGRLLPGQGEPGLCHLRHDPAAAQVVWNLLAQSK